MVTKKYKNFLSFYIKNVKSKFPELYFFLIHSKDFEGYTEDHSMDGLKHRYILAVPKKTIRDNPEFFQHYINGKFFEYLTIAKINVKIPYFKYKRQGFFTMFNLPVNFLLYPMNYYEDESILISMSNYTKKHNISYRKFLRFYKNFNTDEYIYTAKNEITYLKNKFETAGIFGSLDRTVEVVDFYNKWYLCNNNIDDIKLIDKSKILSYSGIDEAIETIPRGFQFNVKILKDKKIKKIKK